MVILTVSWFLALSVWLIGLETLLDNMTFF